MLISQCLAVFVVCWVSLVRSQSGSELQSGPQRWPGVSVSVSSVHNQTGHWTSQVNLHHTEERKSEFSPWLVEVEPRTSSCNGEKPAFDVKLTFIASPPSLTKVKDFNLVPDLGFYKFHPAAELWPRAKQICEEEGGHFVILNSEEESKAMVKIITQNLNNVTAATSKEWFWVGLRESLTTEGEFFTFDGEPLKETGFSRWHPAEPNNKGAGDYVLMHGVGGGLADLPAASGWKLAFVCEIDIC